eukprot:NODE_4447_length_1890_cov_9.009643.p2 GENE.NODE_4447_length_1890_cov_9.009643~~NODE_4447_length_1890_cov_9.009643.p2  ORF type:complete len:525 (-),score=129.99 NODE_4447_length_1890_cov_9.009643:164-1738(-)
MRSFPRKRQMRCFHWHGSRRLIFSELRKLLGDEHGSLRKLAEERDDLLDFFSGSIARCVEGLPQHAVPALGVFADAQACMAEQSGCPGLRKALIEGASTVGGQPMHLLVAVDSEEAFKDIRRAIHDVVPTPWISLVVPPRLHEAPAAVISAWILEFGRLDMMWLPYSSFKAEAWPATGAMLQSLLESGAIGSYGIRAEVHPRRTLAELFDRTPRPAAWLVDHDFTRPDESELLAAAGEADIAVVALPRLASDTAASEAAQHCHALRLGFSVVVRLNGAALELQESARPEFPAISPERFDNLEAQHAAHISNGFISYTRDMFDAPTFEAIVAECRRLWTSEDIEPNCNLDGHHRLGGYVMDHGNGNSSLYKLIYGNEAFRRWVSAVHGAGELWPSDFPIELREYGRESQGMACHSDVALYHNIETDVEFVLTIDNDSGCKTSYYDSKGQQRQWHTEANSVVMVRANAARHCASPTHGGTRTMLKFIYVANFQKSRDFNDYRSNTCDGRSRNWLAVKRRREQREEL